VSWSIVLLESDTSCSK